MITRGEELLKQNAPIVFSDYAARQLTRIRSSINALQYNLDREKDEEKKQSLTYEIELLKKDILFFQGGKIEDNPWRLVGDHPAEPYDFEKDMDEEMAKINVNDLGI